ncbi:MAG: STAS domain-containing protein [Planctomycetaceae bacterium]|nr:STAS domain-containing protein [Planctomycetaceae bacterium]
MSDPQPILEVYQPGETTVVGFGGRDVLDYVNLADCREEMIELIQKTGCKVLAVDMTGVKLIPSGLLGLLAAIRDQNVEVHIYNPSDDVREVLSVTNLDSLMPVHDVAVPGRQSAS